MLTVLPASLIERVVPAVVEEAPRPTLAAESVSVTLFAEVEVIEVAVVLAVMSPLAAPMFRFAALRLAVSVETIEPVTPMVPAPTVNVPLPV